MVCICSKNPTPLLEIHFQSTSVCRKPCSEMDAQKKARILARIEMTKVCNFCGNEEDNLPDAGVHFFKNHAVNKKNLLAVCPLCNLTFRKVFPHFEIHHPGTCSLCQGKWDDHRPCDLIMDKSESLYLQESILEITTRGN